MKIIAIVQEEGQYGGENWNIVIEHPRNNITIDIDKKDAKELLLMWPNQRKRETWNKLTKFTVYTIK